MPGLPFMGQIPNVGNRWHCQKWKLVLDSKLAIFKTTKSQIFISGFPNFVCQGSHIFLGYKCTKLSLPQNHKQITN